MKLHLFFLVLVLLNGAALLYWQKEFLSITLLVLVLACGITSPQNDNPEGFAG